MRRRAAGDAAWSAFLQADAEDRPSRRHVGLGERVARFGEDMQLLLVGGNADQKAVGIYVTFFFALGTADPIIRLGGLTPRQLAMAGAWVVEPVAFRCEPADVFPLAPA